MKFLPILLVILLLAGCGKSENATAPMSEAAPAPAPPVSEDSAAYYHQPDAMVAAEPATAVEPTAVPMSPRSTTLPLPVDKMAEEMKANIAFNAPDEMYLQETKAIQLVLDPVRTLEEVRSMVEEEGEVLSAEIDITPRMSASLKGEGFKISPITPEIQAVLTNKPTEWRWDITPQVRKSSTLSLYLTVNMIMNVQGAETSRAVESFRHEIRVNVTPQDWLDRIVDALSGEWKWLLGTIFIPLFVWWFKQRQGKKKEE